MRRIFRSYPYFLPADPEPIAALFAGGRRRTIEKGGTLKAGGVGPRVFFLASGVCAYYAGEGFGRRPTILSTILPGRIMGDMTAAVGTRCNVHTAALAPSVVIELDPHVFQSAIANSPTLAALQLKNITAKEESLIEGMVANFTRPPEERLLIYAKTLILMTGTPPERFAAEKPSSTENAGPDTAHFIVLPHMPSAERLGEALNLNRVSIAKIISGWQHAGRAFRRNRALYLDLSLFSGIDDWMTPQS